MGKRRGNLVRKKLTLLRLAHEVPYDVRVSASKLNNDYNSLLFFIFPFYLVSRYFGGVLFQLNSMISSYALLPKIDFYALLR